MKSVGDGIWMAGAVLLVCLLLAAPAAADSPLLSNETTFTTWAHPAATALIRERPSATAAQAGALHMFTEDGAPEVYLLLREAAVPGSGDWVLLRIPGRPNGRTGWVPRTALGAFHRTVWALRVNLRLLRATLFRAGRAVWSAPVGVGKPGTPTPTGRFWVRELLTVPGHTIYGPFAFGTSAYSTLSDWPRGGVVGIHGTDQPQLIPGRPSHGCVRMRNADIERLARLLPVGAPVHILG
jgi:hypothetical protein